MNRFTKDSWHVGIITSSLGQATKIIKEIEASARAHDMIRCFLIYSVQVEPLCCPAVRGSESGRYDVRVEVVRITETATSVDVVLWNVLKNYQELEMHVFRSASDPDECLPYDPKSIAGLQLNWRYWETFKEDCRNNLGS
jgi:hypothetical protein